MNFFQAFWDAVSLSNIARLLGFGPRLEAGMPQTLHTVGEQLVTKIHDNGIARFKQNSPGGLAESFQIIDESSDVVEVGSDKPYAWRLEAGYHGTDSLGRHYEQEGTQYFSDAFKEMSEDPGVLQMLSQNVLSSLGI